MLTFPTYLLRIGRVPPLAMAAAIVAQRQARPTLGELAVAKGKLTRAVIDKLVQQQRRRRVKIGQVAVDSGALTRPELESLLDEQASLEPNLVDILVLQGALTRDVAEGEHERYLELERERELENGRSATHARDSFACSVARLSLLKPFSNAVREALTLLSNSDTAPAKVAAVLAADPSITVATLRIANSAMYRRGAPCDSLKDAVVRLGAGTIRDIITGISLLGAFTESDRVANATRQHLAGAAAIARILAGAVAPRLSNVAFLAGLTHDIGKLLLLQSGEFSYDTQSREVLEAGSRVHVLENDALGYDHAILGGLALGIWELPRIVADAVGFHHEPIRAHVAGGDIAQLTSLVVLASELEHHQSLSPHFTSLVERELEAHPEAEQLGLRPNAVEEIWVELVQARAEMAALLAR
ncbi:MAG TPA: HDOD domain-containing protein [Polyangiaceae bacterium]|jgi:HD-like signal output (HDOD) protein|nr:HDOD domain-containing protein [Polyangiaceae bacterium]